MFKKIMGCDRGQSLIELALALPLLLVLSLGTIELANMINDYLVLTHLTREGANRISRGSLADDGVLNCGATANDALDAIITAASPVIQCDDPTRWTVIYSRIVQSPAEPCPPTPCDYIIDLQISRGNPDKTSKIGAQGTDVDDLDLPNVTSLGPGHTLHVVEVFYEYQMITPVAKLPRLSVNIGTEPFYERAIF